MTILDQSELEAAFPDNAELTITPQDFRNLLDSFAAVGGTMYGSAQDFEITPTWEPFASFTASIDTKGLTENLTDGTFLIGPGAGGTYAVDASLGIFSNFAGWIELAITKNGALTPYRKKRTLSAGDDGEFGIPATGNVVAGDVIGLAVRGSGTATVTLTDGQYRAIRIG